MIPGELLLKKEPITINDGQPTIQLVVSNLSDRPIQVGSHYHFYETNHLLEFDRVKTKGHRLNIPAGTTLRFEPGQQRAVELIPYQGTRSIYGFNAKIMGKLSP